MISKTEVDNLVKDLKEEETKYGLNYHRIQQVLSIQHDVYILDEVAAEVRDLIVTNELEKASSIILKNLIDSQKIIEVQNLIEQLNEDGGGLVSYKNLNQTIYVSGLEAFTVINLSTTLVMNVKLLERLLLKTSLNLVL